MNISSASASFMTTGVAAAIATGQGVPPSTPCDTQAEAFFDMSPDGHLNESMSIALIGPNGAGDLAFTSGTSLSAIAAAVNTLVGATGVCAEQSANPMRVRLHSVIAGADAFVSVEQIGGKEPHVFALVDGGRGTWMLIAHGADGLPGDATCDGEVDVDDLFAVIDAWGTCPPNPRPCFADVDVSGTVDIDDLLMVISCWGSTP